MQYEHTAQEMASKLTEFIRDCSDNAEEMKQEENHIAELFSELQKSERFNSLAHHLDIMFMDEIFDI